MKALVVALICLSTPVFAQRTVRVRPSVTRQGVYRQPHVRTTPDRTQRNNWSSKPNVNPYTGKSGHKTPRY
jgi:hypothetical protein